VPPDGHLIRVRARLRVRVRARFRVRVRVRARARVRVTPGGHRLAAGVEAARARPYD